MSSAFTDLLSNTCSGEVNSITNNAPNHEITTRDI